MRNLLFFLSRFGHFVLFVVLETICFVLVFQYNHYQGSAWLSTANVVAGSIENTRASVLQFFSFAENNRRLTARNIELEQQLHYMHSLLIDAKIDAAVDSAFKAVARPDSVLPKATAAQRFTVDMLRLTEGYSTIEARVVGNETHRTNNFITINRGRADGVKPDMGVVSGVGVVGVVYLASDHYSVVIPLVSRQSNVSCALGSQGYFGYLQWDGGDTSVAWVDDVPRHAKLKQGDNVYTSGYSAIFPRGVLIGHVLQVQNSANGLAYRAKVRLATNFANLRDVLVIDNSMQEERLRLMQAARDSIKTK